MAWGTNQCRTLCTRHEARGTCVVNVKYPYVILPNPGGGASAGYKVTSASTCLLHVQYGLLCTEQKFGYSSNLL